jgi:hypothetical protein
MASAKASLSAPALSVLMAATTHLQQPDSRPCHPSRVSEDHDRRLAIQPVYLRAGARPRAPSLRQGRAGEAVSATLLTLTVFSAADGVLPPEDGARAAHPSARRGRGEAVRRRGSGLAPGRRGQRLQRARPTRRPAERSLPRSTFSSRPTSSFSRFWYAPTSSSVSHSSSGWASST